jgi:hypothetical protein
MTDKPEDTKADGKEEVQTFTLSDAKDMIVEKIKASTDIAEDRKGTVADTFNKGFETLAQKLDQTEIDAVKVPEDKINAIYKEVVKIAIIPINQQTNITKNQDALGFVGLSGVIAAGLTDDKAKEAANKKVGDAFAANFTEEADKTAAAEFVNKTQKESEQVATAGKAATWHKVASVGVGVAIAGWFAKQFGTTEVTNENGEVEKKSAPLWKKALLGILTAASLLVAYKVAVKGTEIGTAVGELNPMKWRNLVSGSKSAATGISGP